MKLANTVRQFLGLNPNLVLFAVFLLVWIVASYIFFLRFPNNFYFPNFFAEDGQHFAKNIMEKGFLGALFTPFNGYFIFGIYILTGIGFVLNSLLSNSEFINLPIAFAITSYAFLGLCAALPVLFMRRFMPLYYRLGLALLIILLPFPSFDYGTLGTIGNLKFAFNYIALLLIIYRITLPRSSAKIIAVDAVLLVSAFTTAGVYLLLPFILLSDGLSIYKRSTLKNIGRLFSRQNISLWSALILVTLCIAQIIFIIANGVPKLPGYLDEPYKAASTIEVFVARSYLFPFISTIYHHLNDLLVMILFIGAVGLGVFFGKKEHRHIYIIGMIAILTTSLVFVINRTGTAHYYDHYVTSGFDNFFYAQNFIALLLGMLLLLDITARLPKKLRQYFPPVIILMLSICSIRTNATYAPNDFMQYTVGTLQQQVKPLCSNPNNQTITFAVYPFTFLTMTEPRNIVCTKSLDNHQEKLQDLKLNESQKEPLNIHPGNSSFNQTFIAAHDNLETVSISFGTYYQTAIKNYAFQLLDPTCTQLVRQVRLPHFMRDNAFRAISFDPIADSKGKTYCFSVKPTTNTAQPLAIHVTKQSTYTEGELTISGFPDQRDVVFYLLYN